MQIIAQCPKCGNRWQLNDSAADKRVKCPKCQKLFKVPKLDEVSKAVKIIKQSKGSVFVDESGKTYG